MAFVEDSFTDTPATLLSAHTGETGATWVKHPASAAANLVIRTGGRLGASGAGSIYYASGTPASAEYDVQAPYFAQTVTLVGPTICGRMDTTARTFYGARIDGAASQIQLIKRVSAVLTTLDTAVFTGTIGGLYIIRLEIRDAAKKVYLDGAEVCTSVDNAITDAGVVGVESNQTAADTANYHLDSILAEDPVTGPAPNYVGAFDPQLAQIGWF